METSFGELFTKEKQHHKESYSSRRPKKRKEEERRSTMNCPPQSPDLNSADYLWGQLKTRIYDIIRILMRSLSEIWTQKDISLYLVWLNVSVFSHRWQYRLAQLYGHHFFPVALACLGIKDRNWSRWSVGRSFLLQYLDNKTSLTARRKRLFFRH